MNKKFEILCVDDERQVLEGLRLHLKQHYIVHLADSGAEGLDILRNNQAIAVILSDMRMPAMDGAKFLNGARTAAPNAVRMLLTGYTDMQSAVAAVNEGQIFRFISKPCPPDQLLGAFRAAAVQHRLIVAEKVLLQQTLLGCVESLAKVLSVTKPLAFGRALRIRSKVRDAVGHLGWQDKWQIEAAAMLAQLGSVTLSEGLLLKLHDGEALEDAERREVASALSTSVTMLEGIPRLEPVLDILKLLAEHTATNSRVSAGEAAPEAALLDFVIAWDTLEAQGHSQGESFALLGSAAGAYDAEILNALGGLSAGGAAQGEAVSTPLSELVPGMVLAEDLVRENGVLILPRGFEIDRGLLEHVLSFADESSGAVRVFARC